jgi:lysophospholipase L1-like esterase
MGSSLPKTVKLVVAVVLLTGIVALTAGVWLYGHKNRLSHDPTGPTLANPASAGPSPSSTPPASGAGITFSVLGDSYAEGAGAQPGRGWVQQFIENMCWTLVGPPPDANLGYRIQTSGSTGMDFTPFDSRIAAVADSHPDFVIVQGGVNDPNASPDDFRNAASQFFQALRQVLGPNPTIIAVGPVPTPDRDSPTLAPISAAIRDAATEADIRYIDPVAEDWLNNAELFNEDRFHPTEQGYGEFARRLEASLRGQDIKPAPACA